MYDEDSDRQSGYNTSIKQLDFDIISGGKVPHKETTSTEDEPNEAVTPLSDRSISTVAADSIINKSAEVSGVSPSTHSDIVVQRVGSVRRTVSTDSRSINQQIELTSVSQEGEPTPESITKQQLPNHIQTVKNSVYNKTPRSQITDPIQLQKKTIERGDTLVTAQLKTLSTDNRSTSKIMSLEQSQTGEQPRQEIEEFDPAYHWSGGNPHGSTKPQCIIHIDDSGAESLPFLQRVLRDSYTELEGGRPRIKAATVHGGSIESTTVHGAIVTLDFTTEPWTVSIEDQQISIDYEGQDLIPDLQSIISTLYGGKLGYFVLNIDEKDLQSRFVEDETQELIRTLLPESEDYASDIGSTELLYRTAAPIRLAEPRDDNPSKFMNIVGRYFCFESTDESRIADIEAIYESRLRSDDWRRIALTQQQDASEDESDEHYLWKAAIAAGIAWQMYEEYTILEDEVSFNEFVETSLLPSGPIQSESPNESSDRLPDLKVATGKTWAWNGIRHYIPATGSGPPKGSEVVLEFETGRAEGAFNFRKIYRTLDKYSEESNVWVYLVVPPRTLFRSESQAKMINQLVERWMSASEHNQHAKLCVPVLGQYGCEGLLSAQSLIAEWFGEKNE